MHTHQYQCRNNKTELVKLAAVFASTKIHIFFRTYIIAKFNRIYYTNSKHLDNALLQYII